MGCQLQGKEIMNITEHQDAPDATHDGRLLTPSLCHPHIHLEKCYLFSHQKYSDLEIENGDFAEAMKLTSRSMVYLILLQSKSLLSISGTLSYQPRLCIK